MFSPAFGRNTRYPDHVDGNEEMFHNLLEEKRPLNGWQLRKIMETTDNYDDAIVKIQNAQYGSTEYAIVSGVGKGTIFSKVCAAGLSLPACSLG